MARGRPAKANAVRRNLVDTSHLVEYAGPIDKRLTKLPNRSSFSAETQLYFDVWADSEQAQWFMPTDWLTLRRMARLHEKFIKTGSHFVAAELRQCESLLGATIGDRMRLKVNALKSAQKNQEDEPPTIEADLELFAELNDD
ncbi:hypothetical protein E1264_03580 [Actinomadura sp. KC216]|uniref:phage terminase small subunit n=1 Tax=Actinomadura sp. KC216 TaxID=2530370 RepID=UPI001049E5A7|nr:hypothetical protein [Actinomadura sp. KC216]TDB90918.1 hypothetical protein E1264_03580 [Actinomadura sp. KC216]